MTKCFNNIGLTITLVFIMLSCTLNSESKKPCLKTDIRYYKYCGGDSLNDIVVKIMNVNDTMLMQYENVVLKNGKAIYLNAGLDTFTYDTIGKAISNNITYRASIRNHYLGNQSHTMVQILIYNKDSIRWILLDTNDYCYLPTNIVLFKCY